MTAAPSMSLYDRLGSLAMAAGASAASMPPSSAGASSSAVSVVAAATTATAAPAASESRLAAAPTAKSIRAASASPVPWFARKTCHVAADHPVTRGAPMRESVGCCLNLIV